VFGSRRLGLVPAPEASHLAERSERKSVLVELRESALGTGIAVGLLLVGTLVAFGRYLDADFVGTDTLAAILGAQVHSVGDFLHLWVAPLNAGTSFASTQALFYRPLATLAFSLDEALWGLNPLGYHVTNLLIHAAVVVLAFGMLRAALFSRPAAFVGAALVGFHPSMATAVPVLARRYDALSIAFVYLSLILLWRSLDTPSRGLRAGSVAALVAALLCKESAFGIVPLLPVAAWARGPSRRALRATLPHVIAAALVFGARFAVLGTLGGHAGVTVLGGIDWGGYELMLTRYAQFLVWPLDTWLPTTYRGVAIAIVLLAVGAAALLHALSGLHRRLFVLGLAWVVWFGLFFTALLHMAGAWYMYYPLGGAALMLGVLIDASRKRVVSWQPASLPVVAGLVGAIVLGAAALPASPLVRDYPQWHTAGAITAQVVAAAEPCAEQLQAGDAITFWNLPRDYLDGSRETDFLDLTLLEWFSMEALVEMLRPGESHPVYVGSSVRLNGPIHDLNLRCERPGRDRIRLVATSPDLPVPELPPVDASA
jgi:hypothetical protein